MKQTHKNILRIAIPYIAVLSLLTACGKDTDGFLPDAPVKELTITTHVNGYLPEGAEAGSRASTSGNTFSFTTGDAIGLIGLKSGSVVSECNNIKLTYSVGGNWRSSEPMYDWGATSYIAYYPYRSDMSGKTSVDAIKNAFPIQSDQSTEANFNASNLLTATATLSNNNLKFNFTPAFAMVEVTLPDEMKGYSNASGEKYTYKIYGSSSAAYTFNTSFKKTNKICQRIIKTSASTEIKVTCKIDNMPDVTFTKSVNISQGNYKKLVLGTVKRNLVMGDFVYNDGGKVAFLPNTTTSPPTNNCIGIVMKVGRDTSGYLGDYDSYKQKDGVTSMSAHGYVFSLYDAGGGAFCQWQPVGTLVGTGSPRKYFCGYSNTKMIRSVSGYSSSTFPACWFATNDYEGKYPSPTDTSGWYLPSEHQLGYWAGRRATILSSLQKITGATSWHTTFWSSTEYGTGSTMVGNAYYETLLVDTGKNHAKDRNHYVRSWMTF